MCEYMSIPLEKSLVGEAYTLNDGIVTNVNLYYGDDLDSFQQLVICNTCVFSYLFYDGPFSKDSELKEVIFRESD